LEKSPKKESIGEFSEKAPYSSIPPASEYGDELEDPFADTPGGSRYQAPASELEEEIF
jgi:hypothetical protein